MQIKKRKEQIRFLDKVAFLIALFVLIAVIYTVSTNFRLLPYEEKIVTIPRGSSLDQIADILEKEEVILSKYLFILDVRIKRLDRKIIAGEYKILKRQSINSIVRKIRNGDILLHKLIVPEGLRASLISKIVGKTFPDQEEAFLKLVLSKETASRYGFISPNLEGYLYPETYLFSKDIKADQIVDSMVNMFLEKVKDRLGSEILRDAAKLHYAVTLGSMIEKEAFLQDEFSLISSVYTNRLRLKMRLQCDPTVIYSVKNFDGNITKKDLANDSLYNTYKQKGLPPGAIANPSIEAIYAAINPAKTDYLYFVAKGDSKIHYFSKTFKEHNDAVRKYQLGDNR